MTSKSIDTWAYVSNPERYLSKCEKCDANISHYRFPLKYELVGKKLGDSAFMGGYHLFSKKVVDLFKENNIKGVEFKQTICTKWTDRKGNECDKGEVQYYYPYLSTCGFLHDSAGNVFDMCISCHKPKYHNYLGAYFIESDWDGSDIFAFENLVNLPIVTENLKNLIIKNKLKNIRFEDISKRKFGFF